VNTNTPKFATQLNEEGAAEKVDISVYIYKVLCSEPGCFQVRYLMAQDKSQTKYCKPHARMFRLRDRAARARNKRVKKRLAKLKAQSK
jgi:hypothetical protein